MKNAGQGQRSGLQAVGDVGPRRGQVQHLPEGERDPARPQHALRSHKIALPRARRLRVRTLALEHSPCFSRRESVRAPVSLRSVCACMFSLSRARKQITLALLDLSPPRTRLSIFCALRRVLQVCGTRRVAGWPADVVITRTVDAGWEPC